MRTWKEGEKRYTEYLSLRPWAAIRKSKGLRGEGVEDIEWGPLSVELKTRNKCPQYLFDWLIQAEKNRDNRIPMVILHQDGDRLNKGIILMRIDWFIHLLIELTTKGESNDKRD